MAYISEEEINYIRNQANIVDIINDYVPLKKSGNNYVGICPFHEDHSPSMFVNPSLGIFKCFVCNEGGNVFTFVQKYENVSYPEAIKIVAEKSGVEFKHNVSAVYEGKYKNETKLIELASKFFQNNLVTEKGIKAKDYLTKRNIDDNIIKEFKIGLATTNNSLLEFLKTKKADLNMACDIGLLNKDGIEYYDTFTSRIMIPILDLRGSIVGFTGRTYLNNDPKNKYMNTRETVLYKKSQTLFNYYNAKDESKLQKTLIVVEGNMDAITLSYHGIKNVIALMGVVISPVQIEAIKKLNVKVVLMLDSDEAGKTATIKVGDELIKEIPELYVVRLTGAKDPDEYINKFSVEDLQDNIKHAQKYMDFKLEYLKENKNLNSSNELAEYIKLVLDSLKDATEIEKEVTIAKISKEYNLDPGILKKNLVEVPKEIREKPKIVKEKKSRYTLAAEQLIYMMLLNKDFYMIYMNNLGYLCNKLERDTVSLIGSYINKYKTIDVAGFIDEVKRYNDISQYVNSILLNNNKIDITEKDFYDILDIVSNLIKEEDIKKLKNQIKNELDIAKKVKLMEKLTELKKGGKNEGN